MLCHHNVCITKSFDKHGNAQEAERRSHAVTQRWCVVRVRQLVRRQIRLEGTQVVQEMAVRAPRL